MGTSVILIFDIGKTNKKFFLFDEDLKVIVNQSRSFDEIPDDDGFLSEDLNEINISNIQGLFFCYILFSVTSVLSFFLCAFKK